MLLAQATALAVWELPHLLLVHLLLVPVEEEQHQWKVSALVVLEVAVRDGWVLLAARQAAQSTQVGVVVPYVEMEMLPMHFQALAAVES